MTRLKAMGFATAVAVAFGVSSAWVGTRAPASGALAAAALPPAERRAVADIGFQDERGRAHRLSEFRGRVVLLNLWATWCPPCRKEMPSLDRLQSMLGGPDFAVVAVAVDRRGVEAVKRFYREIGISVLRAWADPAESAGSRLGTIAVPTTLLVDRRGREVGRSIGPAQWDGPEALAKIRAAIGEPASEGARRG